MAGASECGNEPSGSIKRREFLASCKPVSFSVRALLHGVSKYVINELKHQFIVEKIRTKEDTENYCLLGCNILHSSTSGSIL